LVLSDKHIILTHNGSTDAFKILKNLGATLYHYPMIDAVASLVDESFSLLDFDYYVFTSVNGVKYFFNLDAVRGKMINAICLGKKTKEALLINGIEPDFVSNECYADNLLADLLHNKIVNNKKVLLVLGNLADNKIEEGLSSVCKVNRLNVYNTNLETSKNHNITNLIQSIDTISVFTSPSSFQAFSNLYDAGKTTLASIGKTTSEFISSSGFTADIIAEEQTYGGVSKAIINYYETKNI
jgi:uroporphyrinogen-III synthase